MHKTGALFLLAGFVLVVGGALARGGLATFTDSPSVTGNTFATDPCFPGTFGQDSFTDTTGTGLGSHVPETGGGWTSIVNSGTAIIDSNNAKSNASSEILWKVNATCDTSYDVSLDALTGSSVAGRCAGPAGRLVDANNYYRARLCGNGVVTLEKIVTGSATSLGTYSIPSFSTTTFYTIKLELTDSAKNVFVNGTQRISSADNAIAAAGAAGLRHDGGATMRSDNFLAQGLP